MSYIVNDKEIWSKQRNKNQTPRNLCYVAYDWRAKDLQAKGQKLISILQYLFSSVLSR